jgi:hypothetical protein
MSVTDLIAHATPFPELNGVLRYLVEDVRVALGDAFVGAYLQGSFAVGDFDQHSDVDFIIAVRDELTERQIADLQIIHARIFDLECAWAQHLEGSYFPTAMLRDHRRAGTPVWYLDHGSRVLIRSNHCNTALVRSVVREQGVHLAGSPPFAVVDPVPVTALRHEIADAMRRWGKELLADATPYRNRFYQAFIVHMYCRMLHDLVEGRPGSKRAGTEWAKTHLDSEWVGLIDRSWSGRPNPAVSVREPPDAADFERTLAFVRYIMKESVEYGF